MKTILLVAVAAGGGVFLVDMILDTEWVKKRALQPSTKKVVRTGGAAGIGVVIYSLLARSL